MFYGHGCCFERRADTPQIKLIILMEGQQTKHNLNGTYRNGGANVSFTTHLYLSTEHGKFLTRCFEYARTLILCHFITKLSCNTHCIKVTSSCFIYMVNLVFLVVCPNLKIAAATSLVIELCTFKRIFKTICSFPICSVSFYLHGIDIDFGLLLELLSFSLTSS